MNEAAKAAWTLIEPIVGQLAIIAAQELSPEAELDALNQVGKIVAGNLYRMHGGAYTIPQVNAQAESLVHLAMDFCKNTTPEVRLAAAKMVTS